MPEKATAFYIYYVDSNQVPLDCLQRLMGGNKIFRMGPIIFGNFSRGGTNFREWQRELERRDDGKENGRDKILKSVTMYIAA